MVYSCRQSCCRRQEEPVMAWVLSVFRDRSKLTMLALYNSLVRSKLEYCCPLWNPSAVADIQKLENVQRVFPSRVAGYGARIWLIRRDLKRSRSSHSSVDEKDTCYYSYLEDLEQSHQ